MTGPLCEFKSVNCFVYVFGRGRNVTDDECICINCQGLLQESSKLGLSEGCYVAFLSTWKGVYDFAESC